MRGRRASATCSLRATAGRSCARCCAARLRARARSCTRKCACHLGACVNLSSCHSPRFLPPFLARSLPPSLSRPLPPSPPFLFRYAYDVIMRIFRDPAKLCAGKEGAGGSKTGTHALTRVGNARARVHARAQQVQDDGYYAHPEGWQCLLSLKSNQSSLSLARATGAGRRVRPRQVRAGDGHGRPRSDDGRGASHCQGPASGPRACLGRHSSWTHSQVGPGLICSHQPVANLE